MLSSATRRLQALREMISQSFRPVRRTREARTHYSTARNFHHVRFVNLSVHRLPADRGFRFLFIPTDTISVECINEPEPLVEGIRLPAYWPLGDVVRPLVGGDAGRSVAELGVQAAYGSADSSAGAAVAGAPFLPRRYCILEESSGTVIQRTVRKSDEKSQSAEGGCARTPTR